MPGDVRLFPVLVPGFDIEKENLEEVLQRLIAYIGESPAQIIIIDSITLFTEHTSSEAIIDFFTACKSLCDKGKTIFITLHSYAFEEDTLVRYARSATRFLPSSGPLSGTRT